MKTGTPAIEPTLMPPVSSRGARSLDAIPQD
jgi:hypothetical protein